MKGWLTWPNILRAVSTIALIVVFAIDYGFDGFAKPFPKEAYAGLIAIALGVDVPALRGIVLRLLGGGKDGGK
ncbi:hypothetical protein [Maritalea porphyrae]|uniref:hypothetical protein n=1 Tax=Maritalea porphyrae TaxID=880732 RepID=UPI0022AE9AC3|nr:hypothetical protein [Maritalea porphyrae]MCZ4273223.1 hypothetical protein [Maritalea porphyrae]